MSWIGSLRGTPRQHRRRTPVVVTGVVLLAAAALVPAGSAQAASTNLVPNPSVEKSAGSRPASWSPIVAGNNNRATRYLSNGAAAGHRFVRTLVYSYRSGSAGWSTATMAVKARTSYTYTVSTRSNATALVQARLVDTKGRVTYLTLGRTGVSDAWKASTFTFRTPAGTSRLSIRHLLVSVGTLDVDNVRLTLGTGVASQPPATNPPPTNPPPTNPPADNPPPTTPPVDNPPATTPPPTTPPTQQPRGSGGIVSVTFDDGLLSQYQNALPVLRSDGIPGTFYIVTSLIGISTTMSTAQIHAVQSAGNEIGSHTVTHRDLTTLSSSELTAELANSKAALEAEFGTIRSVAYPYGAANSTVAAVAAQYYSSGRTTDGGYNARGSLSPLRLVTRYVLAGTTTSEVASWLAEAASSNTWAILVYHGVENSSNIYSTTPSNFAAQMAAVKASGVPAMTVSDALAAMS